MLDFEVILNKVKELNELKSVAWHTKGDDKFNPERTQVRLEDTEGHVFELVIHTEETEYGRHCVYQEEVLLNLILSHFGLIPVGKWCGINTNIVEIIDYCRKIAPYKGIFFINEADCRKYDMISPEHIF